MRPKNSGSKDPPKVEYATSMHICACGTKFEMKVPRIPPKKEKPESSFKCTKFQYFAAIVFTSLISILLTSAALIVYQTIQESGGIN